MFPPWAPFFLGALSLPVPRLPPRQARLRRLPSAHRDCNSSG